MEKYEMETTTRFDETDSRATVYTMNRAFKFKLAKLAREHPDECTKRWEEKGEVAYFVPKSWIQISPPRKVNMTDEQRAAAAERMKELRKKASNKEKKATP